jgi:hypothetical protein
MSKLGPGHSPVVVSPTAVVLRQGVQQRAPGAEAGGSIERRRLVHEVGFQYLYVCWKDGRHAAVGSLAVVVLQAEDALARVEQYVAS